MTVPVQSLIRVAAAVKGCIALVGLWAVIHLETWSAKDKAVKVALVLICAGDLALCIAIATGELKITF